MKGFTKRKIALLAAIALCIAVIAVQALTAPRSAARTLALTGEIDSLAVEKQGTEIRLHKTADGTWTLGEERLPAKTTTAEALVRAVAEIRVVDTVARSLREADRSRYGLTAAECITVTAFAGENPIRTVRIGKTASTGAQSYLTVDDPDTVYLVSGALGSTFSVTAEALRAPEAESAGEAEAADTGAELTLTGA